MHGHVDQATSPPDDNDNELFTYSYVKHRSIELGCDLRSYYKELRAPGRVRGLVGIAIRKDIERQRRLFARARKSA